MPGDRERDDIALTRRDLARERGGVRHGIDTHDRASGQRIRGYREHHTCPARTLGHRAQRCGRYAHRGRRTKGRSWNSCASWRRSVGKSRCRGSAPASAAAAAGGRRHADVLPDAVVGGVVRAGGHVRGKRTGAHADVGHRQAAAHGADRGGARGDRRHAVPGGADRGREAAAEHAAAGQIRDARRGGYCPADRDILPDAIVGGVVRAGCYVRGERTGAHARVGHRHAVTGDRAEGVARGDRLDAVAGRADAGDEAVADRLAVRGEVADARRAGRALDSEGLGGAVGTGVVGAGCYVRGERTGAHARVGHRQAVTGDRAEGVARGDRLDAVTSRADAGHEAVAERLAVRGEVADARRAGRKGDSCSGES